MLKHLLIAILGLLGALVSVPALAQNSPEAGFAPVSPVVSCASLAAADVSGAVGSPTTQVASVVAGDKPYCKVTARSRTTSISKSAYRWPAGRNGSCKPVAAGCAVICKSISMMPKAVRR